MVRKEKPHKSKEWLTERWVRQNKRLSEIAEEAGVSVQTIRNALKEFGLMK